MPPNNPLAYLFNRPQQQQGRSGFRQQQQDSPFTNLPIQPPAFGGNFYPFPGVNPTKYSPQGATADLVRTIYPFLIQAAPQTVSTGLSTLDQIIGSQGQIDQQLLNKQLAQIAGETQQQQQALVGQQATFGLTSPAFGALNAAIGAAGSERAGQLRAEEARLAEERKRSDLVNLLLPLLIQPALQGSSNLLGLTATSNQGSSDLDSILGLGAGVLGALGSAGVFAGGAAAAAAPAACWVAREIYGADDPRWLKARYYVLHLAPAWFRRFYLKYGERIASVIRSRPYLGTMLKPLFDHFVDRAEAAYG